MAWRSSGSESIFAAVRIRDIAIGPRLTTSKPSFPLYSWHRLFRDSTGGLLASSSEEEKSSSKAKSANKNFFMFNSYVYNYTDFCCPFAQ